MQNVLPGETSRIALASAGAARASQTARVLEAVRAHGAHGATRRELAEELGLSFCRVTSRVWELLGRNKRRPSLPRLVESSSRVSQKGWRNKVLVAVDLARDEDLGRRIEEYVRSCGAAGATRAEITAAVVATSVARAVVATSVARAVVATSVARAVGSSEGAAEAATTTRGPSPNSIRLQVRYLLGECAWDKAAPRLRRNGTRPGPHGIECQVFTAVSGQ